MAARVDLPPRVTEALGHKLREAFGLAGLLLARKETAEALKAEQDRHRLANALEALA